MMQILLLFFSISLLFGLIYCYKFRYQKINHEFIFILIWFLFFSFAALNSSIYRSVNIYGILYIYISIYVFCAGSMLVNPRRGKHRLAKGNLIYLNKNNIFLNHSTFGA
jgi:hypothetical protein